MEQYLTIFLITLVTGAGGLALGAARAGAEKGGVADIKHRARIHI